MRLHGRVAAITGGALGIGRATALCFAAEGATVALGDVEVGAAEKVAGEIVERGGHALAVGWTWATPGRYRRSSTASSVSWAGSM
jgi:NAD(P)-dependent dehydrogenase (short-subunit alcohol dehydrogenase family)